eukprot:gene8747-6152_t
MKFWVKAVVDRNVQEQLLVAADSIAELRSQLEELLDIVIDSMSATDFQHDVVDQLNDSTSIIKVVVRTAQRRPLGGWKDLGSEIQTPSPTGLDKNNAFATAPSTRTSRKLSSATSGRDYRTTAEEEVSYVSDSPSLRVSYSHDGAMHDQSERESSSNSAPAPFIGLNKKALFDVPRIEKICLKRDSIMKLLHKKLKRKFVSVLTGCFARVRELHGYFLYQISDVTADNKLIFDRIYSKDKRELDTVSNALPVKDEINSWMKKMLSCSRPYPTNGFIEAKHGDMISALRIASTTEKPPYEIPPPPPSGVYHASPRGSADAAALDDSNEDEMQNSQGFDEELNGTSRTRKGSLVDPDWEASAAAAAAVEASTAGAPVPVTPSATPTGPTSRAAVSMAAAVSSPLPSSAAGGTTAPVAGGRPSSASPSTSSSPHSGGGQGGRTASGSSRESPSPGILEATAAGTDNLMPVSGGETPLRHESETPQNAQPPTPLHPQPQPPPDEEEPRARRLMALRPLSQACFPTGKISIKVNDIFTYVQVKSVTNVRGHHQHFQLLVSASRQSNAVGAVGARRPRRSDFSGCLLRLDPVDSTIIKDRDITEKGFAIYCFPVRWGDVYVSLGQLRPVTGDAPYLDDATGQLVQQFSVLYGPAPDSLYDSKPTKLPLPQWCGTNPSESCICQVKIVVHRGALHALYVVRHGAGAAASAGADEFSTAPSSYNSANTLAPLEPTSSGGPVPLTIRSLTSLAPRETPGSSPSKARGNQLAPLDSSALGSVDTSVLDTSSVHSVSPSTHPLSPSHSPALPPKTTGNGASSVDGRERYSLVHAVMASHSLEGEWRLLTPAEPLCTTTEEEPIFAVYSVDFSHDGTSESRSRSRSPSVMDSSGTTAFNSQLNIAWRASRSSVSQSTSPRKFLHPVRPALPKYRDPSCGKAALPFQRMTNASEGTSFPYWREDTFYAANRVDPAKVKQDVTSVSLFQSAGSLYMTCGYNGEGKLLLWTIPILNE